MTTTLTPSRTVSVAIACPAQVVHDFIAAPEHLQTWAPDLAPAVAKRVLQEIQVSGEGGCAEVSCTLRPGDAASDDQFSANVVRLERGLQTLRRLLEAEEF